jgi:hypothetical protein
MGGVRGLRRCSIVQLLEKMPLSEFERRAFATRSAFAFHHNAVDSHPVSESF